MLLNLKHLKDRAGESGAVQRPVFTIRLRALPNVDSIKAIRRVLKYALRQCGLRALSVTEEQHQEPRRAESETAENA
jgi:hypothetical protein